MTRRRLWTAALLFLLIPTLISAQTPTPVTIDFYGTIDTNLGGTLVINGRVVDVRNAQMDGLLLAPGIDVHIQAEAAPNGTLIAHQLDLVPVGLLPGLVELNGTVTAFTLSSLHLGNQIIDTSTARIIGTIAVGQPAQVFASATNSNLWSARIVLGGDAVAPIPPVVTPEVVAPADAPVVVQPIATPEIVPPADAPVVVQPVTTPEVIPPVSTPEVSDDFRVEGRLEAVNGSNIVVDGQTYDISSARIDDPLAVGAFVRMEVYLANGVFIVERIRAEDN
jgi:hypothetical protein